MKFLGALITAAAAAVVTYAAVDLYMAFRSELTTDAELQARRMIAWARHQYAIDRQVAREAPYLHWEAFQALEEADQDAD